MLEPRSFDTHKNATVLMLTMLGCSELDIEISDTSIETVESNDCKGISKDDRNANGVLAMMQKKQDFPIKMDRSLLTHLSSQLVDCVRQASCIQELKSRKNQAK